jgi:hypothetical protein
MGAMALEAQCPTIVEVEGGERFVSYGPHVVSVQVHRISGRASRSAVLARVVVPTKDLVAPLAVFRG